MSVTRERRLEASELIERLNKEADDHEQFYPSDTLHGMLREAVAEIERVEVNITIRPAVLNVTDAGTYMAVSPDTVRRLVRDGALPHVRVGNSIRIHREHLDSYLRDRTTTTWERVDRRGLRVQ